MTTDVVICNLALGNIGDAATVTSLDPPEGSAQAEHCARFYPLARDALLEMHQWSFATRRVALALLEDNPSSSWAYCYAQPNDMLNAIAVLDPSAPDDSSAPAPAATSWYGAEVGPMAGGIYTPQEFVLESLEDGRDVVLTNQADAVMRYTVRVTDPSKFSPLFTRTLAASLASMLAGPVIKGDAGISVAAKWEFIAFGRDGKSGLFGKAAASDAGDRRVTHRERQQVPWLVGR